MNDFPLKVDTDSVWFDMTGPDWLVNLCTSQTYREKRFSRQI
jgi:hypothetical protein